MRPPGRAPPTEGGGLPLTREEMAELQELTRQRRYLAEQRERRKTRFQGGAGVTRYGELGAVPGMPCMLSMPVVRPM